MIKNYLKTTWRNLIRNKSFSAINILGLALGLVFSLLILLWVQNELSVDGFHKNSSQLYTVYERVNNDNKISGVYNTQGLLALELKKAIPEVKYAVNTTAGTDINTFKVGEKILMMN